jgi:hypothetical protein
MAEITETNPKGAGAPLGHTNASKNNRIWGDLIRKLAVQEDYRRLHTIANALYEKAADGDMNAIKEIGDRLDGKAMQENKISGDADAPLLIQVVTGIDDNY